MGHPWHSKHEPRWLALQDAVKSMETSHYAAASLTWEVAAFAKIAAGSSLYPQRREEAPFAWKRMDCPEPRVGLGACRWLIKSFTQFGNGETRQSDVRSISNHLHVCRRQERLWNPLFLTKDCTVPEVRLQGDPTPWETLTVKVTWKAHHQCGPSPPDPSLDVPQLSLQWTMGLHCSEHPGGPSGLAISIPWHFPKHATRCNRNMPSCNLACVTRCWEAFVQPQSVFSCYNPEQNVHNSINVKSK